MLIWIPDRRDQPPDRNGDRTEIIDDIPVRRRIPQKHSSDRVKAYRELHRTLSDGESLATKDVLKIDRVKIRGVFLAIVKLFRDSLKSGDLYKSLTQNIMRSDLDESQKNEE